VRRSAWPKSGPAVTAAEAAVKSPTGSRPLLNRQESPLPRREDDAPVFRSSNGSRATDATRIAHPAALTPRWSRRHLWQARRASLRLRHNDRIKKGAPPYLNSYPSPPPLSLATGIEKGDVVERILLGEGSGPRALLLIRVSKAGPSKGFRQLPQSTRTSSPLLIRGSKAGPSEGLDSRPRTLGLRAHY
jgi:hypothetical protein